MIPSISASVDVGVVCVPFWTIFTHFFFFTSHIVGFGLLVRALEVRFVFGGAGAVDSGPFRCACKFVKFTAPSIPGSM